jgi:hypothetical protein
LRRAKRFLLFFKPIWTATTLFFGLNSPFFAAEQQKHACGVDDDVD